MLHTCGHLIIELHQKIFDRLLYEFIIGLTWVKATNFSHCFVVPRNCENFEDALMTLLKTLPSNMNKNRNQLVIQQSLSTRLWVKLVKYNVCYQVNALAFIKDKNFDEKVFISLSGLSKPSKGKNLIGRVSQQQKFIC